MNSYGDYSSKNNDTDTWSYGGAGASVWEAGGYLSMAGGITGPRPGSSSASTSFFLPDDFNWRSWPSIINSIPATDSKSRSTQRRDELDSLQLLPPVTSFQPSDPESNTLCMSNLEPWMDHEYASQVVQLMGWDRTASSINTNSNNPNIQSNPVTVKIPPSTSDTIPQPNNPGYCLITFPTAAQAASVLASLHSLNSKSTPGAPLLMPNSSRPFNLQWASPTQLSQAFTLPFPSSTSNSLINNLSLSNNSSLSSQGPQKEYSIFVGDLAPETSNSDLVAVFRNPVLGLRNDREPKFIRPFYSCKSAKIMSDPVTGVSRGYGFVRFTDEADQQRALIEMHGLYCLSRPMRVSPATAKFKPNAINNGTSGHVEKTSETTESANGKPPLVRSVSSPVAIINAGSPTSSNVNHTGSKLSNSNGSNTPEQSSATTPNPEQPPVIQITPQILAQIKELAAEGPKPQVKEWDLAHIQQMVTLGNLENTAPQYQYPTSLYSNGLLDEAWNHQVQARAILGNLIGPNGEQLTSTDPYNTTVFVGGLSPLISEETLRTFFAPFGDIHYVKVPLGKHCGFVQFVRKADAERAIDRMQGFPIGGSRIRLSWGRSQCMLYYSFVFCGYDRRVAIIDKAAQAAAQAAQQAQTEHAARLAAALANSQGQSTLQLTQEQAIQLLHSINSVLPTSADSQSAQFQQTSQNIPTISTSMEKSPSNPLLSGLSAMTISLPSSYSQGFNGGSSPSERFGEDIPLGDPSISPNSRFNNLRVYPNTSYTEGSSTFQASDILRNESQLPFARIAQQQPQSEMSSVRRTPPRMQGQRRQSGLQTTGSASQINLKMRDDTENGNIYLTELGTSLATLDLGNDRYSRVSLMNDARVNGGFGERRPLSNSISAPLNNLGMGTKITSET
ncbi:hypothetical protein Clacol_001249 [Clathrus columnatus]|uniref:RRM domain-containing protein n=1 Tax=Clathrus columnatus TaxID=1419009 RepID=A0AAV4ZYS1_9AGAM|nr:hypothetical protein Clacol_001249 [Clathrus columnatus]